MAMIDLNAKKITGPVIRLHPSDNVVVARTDVAIGMEIPSEGITSRS
jgi:altronate hydrolase